MAHTRSMTGGLPCTGITIGGAAHGEHGKYVIFIISDAMRLDLLFGSLKENSNEPIVDAAGEKFMRWRPWILGAANLRSGAHGAKSLSGCSNNTNKSLMR